MILAKVVAPNRKEKASALNDIPVDKYLQINSTVSYNLQVKAGDIFTYPKIKSVASYLPIVTCSLEKLALGANDILFFYLIFFYS